MARARERFAAERRHLDRRRRQAERRGSLPNLIVIGGLKCGTTSLHHYLNLHPQIAMSRPKELNFFVDELNWELGPEWYASHFDRDAEVRGETSPHYTNLPRFEGVAERMRELLGDARGSSTWSATRSSGCSPTTSTTSAAATSRGRWRRRSPTRTRPTSPAAATRCSSSPTSTRSSASASGWSPTRSSRASATRPCAACSSSSASTPTSRSEQFEREWETGSGKQDGGFRLMDRAVRLPGLRALDRNFDRLPESLRWLVERVVHDPGRGAAPKPRVAAAAARRRWSSCSATTSPSSSGSRAAAFGWL